jgi:hypothetical protein
MRRSRRAAPALPERDFRSPPQPHLRGQSARRNTRANRRACGRVSVSAVEKKWWFWVACFLLTTVVYAWFEVRRQVSELSDQTVKEAEQRVLEERSTAAEAVSVASEYEIAPYGELQKKIKAGLVGTISHCELGPASSEQQAQWAKLREPRAHGRLSSAELFDLADSDLYLELTSRLQDKQYALGLGAMSVPEQTVSLINELEFEVANGGFDQYFSNSSGNCALRALAAARAVDARIGDIVARALAAFPHAQPHEDRATRNQQMDAMPGAPEVWAKVESELDDDLSPLVERYIRAHKDQFDCPPQLATP